MDEIVSTLPITEINTDTMVEIDSKLPDANVNVSKSITAEIQPDTYVLTSGGMYTGNMTGAVPTWILNAIQQQLTTGDGNLMSVLDDMRLLLDGLELGVNQAISQIENTNTSMSALETSVVSRLNGNDAAILDVYATRVTATEAQAVAVQAIGSTFNGNVDAYIGNLASTYTDANSATATNIRTLQASYSEQTARIDTVEYVKAGLFPEWDGISTPNIGEYKESNGVFYTYVGGTIGEFSDGWMRSTSSPYTYTDSSIQFLEDSTGLLLEELKNQIDGVIDSWYYSYVPDQSKEPWSTWIALDTTNGNTNEQIRHSGDLFYDLSTGIAYRFALSEGVFGWSTVTDTIVTLALKNASTAQYTADGKASIYYSETIPVTKIVNGTIIPIKKGDLWVQISTGITKVAVIDNPTTLGNWGNVSNSAAENALLGLADLEEARDGVVVVYYLATTAEAVGMTYGDYLVDTDSWNGSIYNVYRYENTSGGSSGTLLWRVNTGELSKTLSAGYRAQVTSNSAIENAALAQSGANTANALLADIANDDKLTAAEKQKVKLEWDIIVAEVPKILANAVSIGILTTDSVYLTYNNAITPYGKYQLLLTYITPLLADLTTTSTISGTVFRATFKAYYDAKIDLLNVISVKASQTAQWTSVASRPTSLATLNATDGTALANATTAITNISSDNVLSAVEKSAVRKEWNTIVGEKATIEAQADVMGISTEKIAYVSSIIALGTYLNAGVAWTFSTSTIPTWINDASLSINTTIVGSTFRTAFVTYYTARETLILKINSQIKGLADSKSQIIYSTNEPTLVTHPLLDTGDQWVDTDDGVVKIWTGTNWGNTSNSAAENARNGVLHNAALATPPMATGKNDIWVVTNRWYDAAGTVVTVSGPVGQLGKYKNLVKVWDGTAWIQKTLAETQSLGVSWVGGASKLLYGPDGGITGWEFADGSGLQSEFKINAQKFSISDGTTGYTPFSITGSDINFLGKVSFNSVTDVPQLGSTPQEVVTAINSGNTTTINGGRITTGSITANQIAANTITADRFTSTTGQSSVWSGGGLVSSNFNGNVVGSIGTPTQGFRLSSSAASTSADPNIYGGYIKGGTIEGTTLIGGTAIISSSVLGNTGSFIISESTSASSTTSASAVFNTLVNKSSSVGFNSLRMCKSIQPVTITGIAMSFNSPVTLYIEWSTDGGSTWSILTSISTYNNGAVTYTHTNPNTHDTIYRVRAEVKSGWNIAVSGSLTSSNI